MSLCNRGDEGNKLVPETERSQDPVARLEGAGNELTFLVTVTAMISTIVSFRQLPAPIQQLT
jgi:hypothetical protein